jgi:hypothetical protein
MRAWSFYEISLAAGFLVDWRVYRADYGVVEPEARVNERRRRNWLEKYQPAIGKVAAFTDWKRDQGYAS